MKTAMKKPGLLILALLLLIFNSCMTEPHEPDPSEVLCTLCYENASGHDLHLEMYVCTYADLQTHKAINLKKVVSLDIPSGSVSYKDLKMSDFQTFYACSITFDDGKELKYEKENTNERVNDKYNPVSLAGYLSTSVAGMMKVEYRISEEHYSLAE